MWEKEQLRGGISFPGGDDDREMTIKADLHIELIGGRFCDGDDNKEGIAIQFINSSEGTSEWERKI